MDGRNKLPFFEGYVPINNPDRLALNDCPVFMANYTYAVSDDSVPHMTCSLADSSVSDSNVLRSEIVTAITLMKRQARSLRFPDHHTIPVLVVSFQHDRAARITQAHFDGNRIFIRQSRQLNLRGDEPTEDAYLLVRWMAGTPIGDTTCAASTPLKEVVRNQDTGVQQDNTVAITV
ncbi:MAG: hypothetical protein M1822_009114 [Bathelium mastoideum]|nr:MAG: hypothetical protein M1822_009114 [Bathelium mastoideum]